MKTIQINQKSAVELEEYQGGFSLISCWYSTKKDEWVQQWATMQFGKEEKRAPVKVYLGQRDKAIQVLEEALAELRGNNKPPKREQTPQADAPIEIPDDEIPF